MKIIFKDEKERAEFFEKIGRSLLCPEDLGFKNGVDCSKEDNFMKCEECWMRCGLVTTSKYTWKDVVKVNGDIYVEEFPISGEKDNNDIYCIDEFIEAVAIKYGVSTDDVETYMMDDIGFDPSTIGFGAEDCGCYIYGEPEWNM